MIFVAAQVICRSSAFLSQRYNGSSRLIGVVADDFDRVRCFSSIDDQSTTIGVELDLDRKLGRDITKSPWSADDSPKKKVGINKSRFRQRK